MNISPEVTRQEMSALQSVVKIVRRAKSDSRCSFKGVPLTAIVPVLLSSRIALLLEPDTLETAQRLLRLDCLELREQGESDDSIGYDWFAGCFTDAQAGIAVTLWSTRNPWEVAAA